MVEEEARLPIRHQNQWANLKPAKLWQKCNSPPLNTLFFSRGREIRPLLLILLACQLSFRYIGLCTPMMDRCTTCLKEEGGKTNEESEFSPRRCAIRYVLQNLGLTFKKSSSFPGGGRNDVLQILCQILPNSSCGRSRRIVRVFKQKTFPAFGIYHQTFVPMQQ